MTFVSMLLFELDFGVVCCFAALFLWFLFSIIVDVSFIVVDLLFDW